MRERACPTCARRYAGDAAFCPADGTRLVDAAPPPAAAVAPGSVHDPTRGASASASAIDVDVDADRAALMDTGLDLGHQHAGDASSWAPGPDSRPEHTDFALGGRLVGGRFKVLSLLGRGGMGVVYLAHQVSVDRDVALKVLHAELAHDPQLVRRFQVEARAASRITHPNGVVVYDFGIDEDGLCFLAMEFVKGQNLHDALKAGGPLPARRAVHVVDQVLAYLEELHSAGILHRDLKPENVFLLEGKGDRAKVIDFGLAKVAEDPNAAERLTRQGAVFGTPFYMSPEQGAGETVDARTDLYACGIILYELLCGQPPFGGGSTVQILRRHMTAPVPHPREKYAAADVPEALWAVLQHVLAKQREERPADARALRALLHPFLSVAPAAAAPVPPQAAPRAARTTPAPISSPDLLVAPDAAAGFLGDVERLLTERVGPMGRVLVGEALQEMALTPENLPRGAVGELITRLVEEIPAGAPRAEAKAALERRAQGLPPVPGAFDAAGAAAAGGRASGGPISEALITGAALARLLGALETLLRDAVGPMAAIVLDDALEEVGAGRDALARPRLVDLVRLVAENVPPARRSAFQSRATELASAVGKEP